MSFNRTGDYSPLNYPPYVMESFDTQGPDYFTAKNGRVLSLTPEMKKCDQCRALVLQRKDPYLLCDVHHIYERGLHQCNFTPQQLSAIKGVKKGRMNLSESTDYDFDN